jgi:hypothetical protein
MARRHGSKGSVEMDPTGGSTAVPVASLNSWSLDMARDRADATCFGDTNKVWVQGLPNIEGEIGGIWDEAASQPLFEVALGDVAAFLKLIPSTLAPTYLFSGLAYLDAGIEVAHDGAITVNGSFAAAGPWTMEPAGVMTSGARRGVELSHA